ncbi:MAG: hypothetical protein ACI31S_06700 [Bacilli bacterium]
MDTYERESIGNIIIVKNIIFKNTIINKNVPDHSFNYGRPCIIIYSDEKYDYLLTLTSKEKEYPNQYFKLEENDLLPMEIYRYRKYDRKKSRQKKTTGFINLQNIYKIPISGHDLIGKVTFNTFKEVINKLKKYHKENSLKEIIVKAENIRGR